MASTPTEIGPPYTYEEALVVQIQDGLMVDLFPECTKVEPDFWIGRTCHDRFLLPVDGVPSNWRIQLVCPHLVSNDRKKDKSTPTGTISAMLFAIPASVFFGYSCQVENRMLMVDSGQCIYSLLLECMYNNTKKYTTANHANTLQIQLKSHVKISPLFLPFLSFHAKFLQDIFPPNHSSIPF
jgi:hypothetical protein